MCLANQRLSCALRSPQPLPSSALSTVASSPAYPQPPAGHSQSATISGMKRGPWLGAATPPRLLSWPSCPILCPCPSDLLARPGLPTCLPAAQMPSGRAGRRVQLLLFLKIWAPTTGPHPPKDGRSHLSGLGACGIGELSMGQLSRVHALASPLLGRGLTSSPLKEGW